MADRKLISITTPCYNEQENVEELYRQVRDVFATLPQYQYEHIFIDNASTDNTVKVLRGMAAKDPRVRIIVNTRNFGSVRSGYYAVLQANGDAVISIVADLQEPPGMIVEFLKKWEEGHKLVKGIKTASTESRMMYGMRQFYYNLVSRLSDVKLSSNFTGFGLYDRQVISALSAIHDPYPYIRGLVSELGFDGVEVPYVQPRRHKGRSSYTFYQLYDMAMLGITSHSKVPLRLAIFGGLAMSLLSCIVAFGYLVAKLVFWEHFPLGMAPMLISIFLLSSVQLFSIGVLGEYIGLIHMRSLKRPLVVEKERVNFGNNPRT